MARTTSRAALALAGLTLLLGAATLFPPASLPAAAYASTAAGGASHDGYCTEDTGVTVVVDASALDGGVSIRCVPDAAGMSGLEALKAAGFDVTGTRRYGEAFVCRIDNRPGPGRKLSIPGNDDYRETCANTPPTAAMWSYWSADDGDWAYSQAGPKSAEVEPGDAQGWSFSLDKPEAGNPPGVGPVRQGAAPAQDATRTPSPDATAAPSAGSGSDASGSDGGSVAPWAAAGVIVVLGGLGSLAALRRRRTGGGA